MLRLVNDPDGGYRRVRPRKQKGHTVTTRLRLEALVLGAGLVFGIATSIVPAGAMPASNVVGGATVTYGVDCDVPFTSRDPSSWRTRRQGRRRVAIRTKCGPTPGRSGEARAA